MQYFHTIQSKLKNLDKLQLGGVDENNLVFIVRLLNNGHEVTGEGKCLINLFLSWNLGL